MYDNITQTAIAVENPSQSAGNSDQTTKDSNKGNYIIYKTSSFPFVRYFHTLFWDDIMIIC